MALDPTSFLEKCEFLTALEMISDSFLSGLNFLRIGPPSCCGIRDHLGKEPCEPSVTIRQQDEAAGETGVSGLEKCPGQIGHPVHIGPDPVSWVGGWREPRRNSAKPLRARSDGARPACERHARGTRGGGVSVYKRAGCLWALRACELCRGVGDDGTVRVRAEDTRKELCTCVSGCPRPSVSYRCECSSRRQGRDSPSRWRREEPSSPNSA